MPKATLRPAVLAQWSRYAPPAAPRNGAPPNPDARRERFVLALVSAMQKPRVDTAAPPRRVPRYAAVVGVAAPLLLVASAALSQIGNFTVARNPFARPNGPPSVAASPAVAIAPLQATPNQGVSLSWRDADGREHLRMRLLSGVEITAPPRTRMALPDSTAPLAGGQSEREEVTLDFGLIHVDVPKLSAGHVFAVRTPDAVVTVRGTSFSVEVTNRGTGGDPVTTVIVTTGVVGVQHGADEVLLSAGSKWSSEDERATPPVALALAPKAKTAAAASGTRATALASAGPDHGAARAANDTDLANENRLFAEAMNAREKGEPRAALAHLEECIRLYPTLALTEDAHVERFRTLAQMGDQAAAARAARVYLSTYGGGFARSEARALALEPPPGH